MSPVRWFWEWRCHGLVWQVIPSRRYPERGDWDPTCPACGRKPERKWARA